MNEIFPTLYKRDSKGKIRIWCMEILDDKYRTIAGLRDGNLVTSAWTIAKGKNAGKVNETTGEEQALNEIEAKYKKQLAVDYHESEDDVDVFKVFKPMLAAKYPDRLKKIKWDMDTMIQPKLDGIRCIASERGLFSRAGKPIVAVPHISDELVEFFKQNPGVVLDGELYNHDLKHDFNKIVSLVRKTKPTAADLAETAEKVEYHIYDIADGVGDLSYRDRHSELSSLFILREYPMDKLVLVNTDFARDEAECDTMHGLYLQDGYEGSILRLNGKYGKNKRSNDLLKRKDFDDDEFEVTGYEEGEGNFAGLPKVITIKVNGVDGKATMRGSREYLQEVKDNWDEYVGGQANVQFFGYTADGALRFPTVKVLYKGKRFG